MGEIADYFKREKYITRRLSLLVLGGTVLLTPIALASSHRLILPRALEWAIFIYVGFVAIAVIFIVRDAHEKFPKSSIPDNSPLDKATRRKLRRRIWFLQGFVVIYAGGLFNVLVHARRNPWLITVISATLDLLVEVILIKAIRRLRRKLRVATAITAAP